MNLDRIESVSSIKNCIVMDVRSTASSDSVSSSMGMDYDAHYSLFLTLSPPGVSWLTMYNQP